MSLTPAPQAAPAVAPASSEGGQPTPAPSLQELMNKQNIEAGNNGIQDLAGQQEVNKDPAQNVNDHEKLLEEQREVWREKQKLKMEREQFEQNQNASKDNGKGSEIEDIVNNMLGLEDKEAEPQEEVLTQDQLIEKATEKAYEKLKAEMAERDQKTESETSMTKFQEHINTSVSDNENLPLVNGMKGGKELILEAIKSKFLSDSEEFGADRAKENMMTIEEASAKTEKYLASEIDKVLEYPQMRSYLMNKINGFGNSEDGNNKTVESTINQDKSNSADQNQNKMHTLNNSQHHAEGMINQSQVKMDDDSRFERAMSKVIK